MKRYIENVKKGNKGKGQAALLKHLLGGRITQRQAIQAKCYDCNGMGEQDSCVIETCPLFGYTPMKKISVSAPS